jgi:hypothetical protein
MCCEFIQSPELAGMKVAGLSCKSNLPVTTAEQQNPRAQVSASCVCLLFCPAPFLLYYYFCTTQSLVCKDLSSLLDHRAVICAVAKPARALMALLYKSFFS